MGAGAARRAGVRGRSLPILVAAVVAWRAPSAAHAATYVASLPEQLGVNGATGLSAASVTTQHYYVDPVRPMTRGPTVPGPAGRAVPAPADDFTPGPVVVRGLAGFNIVIVPDAGLAANAPALLAFNRAARQWADRIADPITVTVDAGLAALPPGVIGSTGSVTLQGGYNVVRNQMVADAAGNANKTIVANLPTAAQFTATIPLGRSLDGNALLTKANAKALGFTGLDDAFGAGDGAITFSSSFNFDYDNADGVTAGRIDFETVAAHEIGHLLGFFSMVDSLDTGELAVGPSTLDLFRFRNLPGFKPTTGAQFATLPRSLVPGADEVTADALGEWRMSTGNATGDGRQASHWKDDALTGDFVGLMDPTLASGVVELAGDADFRAMELIGYDVVVPEPGAIAFLALGAVVTGARRRRS
jgi:hypothetical protein